MDNNDILEPLEADLWSTLEAGGRLWNEREANLLHEFAVRCARAAEVHYRHNIHGYSQQASVREAAARYPLPPKRVLREEPDPNGGDVKWRWSGVALEYRPNATAYSNWNPLINDPHGRVFAPYPERVDLWHSLKHNPYREVPDNGASLPRMGQRCRTNAADAGATVRP